MTNWIFVMIAALSGAAMALQGTLNTALGKIVGVWESTLIVHVVGALAALGVVLCVGGGMNRFSNLGQAPWYVFLGGVLNVIIVYAVIRSMDKIGVGNATTAIIVAQVSTAILIDALGAFGMKKFEFHYLDILGIVLLATGARILLMD
ncbi:MAG: DMT family transporter [Syntrophomonadaceae bacterium]|jgi:transporter family-2 protein